MKEFLCFLSEYKEVILSSLCVVFSLLCFLLKRRPQVNFNGLLNSITHWIYEAEQKFRIGSDKMNYVLDHAKVALGDSFDESSVRSIVEWILELPQKKDL